MPNQKFEITNPQAIKLMADLKSGAFWVPIKAKLFRFRWIFISLFVFTILVLSLVVGKIISSRAEPTIFVPQDIDTPNPSQTPVVKSKYEPLREEIIYFNTELPDPGIPLFDNGIDLETPTL